MSFVHWLYRVGQVMAAFFGVLVALLMALMILLVVVDTAVRAVRPRVVRCRQRRARRRFTAEALVEAKARQVAREVGELTRLADELGVEHGRGIDEISRHIMRRAR